jgi:hypothetical protein
MPQTRIHSIIKEGISALERGNKSLRTQFGWLAHLGLIKVKWIKRWKRKLKIGNIECI